MILHQDQEGATPTRATIHMFFLMENNEGQEKCVDMINANKMKRMQAMNTLGIFA